MAKIDHKYRDIVQTILAKGFRYEDPKRKGIFRWQIPKYNFHYSFEDGFPLMTTKKINVEGIVGEFIAFVRGSTHVRDLTDLKANFWFKDAYNRFKRHISGELDGIDRSKSYDFPTLKEFIATIKSEDFNKINDVRGELGPIYSAQMRSFGERNIDQLSNLINTLRVDPLGTKRTVTMWNPSDEKDQALSCCHWAFEILVEPTTREEKILNPGIYYKFNLQWHQHSVDTFLGLPFNIAYYSFMAYLIGAATGMKPAGIYGNLTNVHLYEKHLDAVTLQLNRSPDKYQAPEFKLRESLPAEYSFESIAKRLVHEDFIFKNYSHYPFIKAEMFAYD